MRFSEIVGNEGVKKALKGMADSGHVPHAMMFFENDGCGALPMILAFYSYLNCGNHQDGDACGTCPACNQIGKLIYPDLHFVFPLASGLKGYTSDKISSEPFVNEWRSLVAENPYFTEIDLLKALKVEGKAVKIGVGDAKSILGYLSLSSYSDGYRAVVIYLPEKMNAEAANRLLKAVEEPYEKTLFLFITHAPEKVLTTITSRCQSIRLMPLTKSETAEVLKSRFSIDAEEAESVAEYSGGSVGEALHIHEENAGMQENREMFSSLMTALLSKDLLSALEVGERLADLGSREKQKAFCKFASDCVRKIFMFQIGMTDISAVHTQEAESYRFWAQKCSARFCSSALQVIDKAVMLVERNVNQKIVFAEFVGRLFYVV